MVSNILLGFAFSEGSSALRGEASEPPERSVLPLPRLGTYCPSPNSKLCNQDLVSSALAAARDDVAHCTVAL